MTLRHAGVALVLGCLSTFATASGCSSPTQPSGPVPTISQISPASAAFGDTVTVTGAGFRTTGNALSIGGGYLSQASPSDGSSVRFVLSQTTGACPPTASVCVTLAVILSPGVFQVSVVNASGTSNSVSLQVNSR